MKEVDDHIAKRGRRNRRIREEKGCREEKKGGRERT
jgi:hypothetical protein